MHQLAGFAGDGVERVVEAERGIDGAADVGERLEEACLLAELFKDPGVADHAGGLAREFLQQLLVRLGERRHLARVHVQHAANLAALDEIKRLFPNLSEAEMGGWLINCTAFPFASIPDSMGLVRDLAARSKGNHELAVQLADEDVSRAMANPIPETTL